MPITIQCQHCGGSFSIRRYRLATAKFCSKACGDEHKRVTIICGQCKSPFVRKRKDKDTAKFCSRKCRGKWDSANKRGENAANYRNGNSIAYDPVLCRRCGKPFLQLRRHLNNGFGDICSKECRAEMTSQWQKANSVARVEKILCKCEMCGTEKTLVPSFAKSFRFCSKQCRHAWQSTRMKGGNHPLWNNGSAHLRSRLSVTREYKEWRRTVFIRDRFTCQRCGDKRGGNLHAHHIKMVSTDPELVYEVSNGLTLCNLCHTEVHRTMPNTQGRSRIGELFA